MGKVRYNILISGLVQGVFFRAETCSKAAQYGVFGWVRNLADGRVEVMVEGERENVVKLIEFCKHGPLGARVDKVEIEEEEYRGEFNNFTVKYRF